MVALAQQLCVNGCISFGLKRANIPSEAPQSISTATPSHRISSCISVGSLIHADRMTGTEEKGKLLKCFTVAQNDLSGIAKLAGSVRWKTECGPVLDQALRDCRELQKFIRDVDKYQQSYQQYEYARDQFKLLTEELIRMENGMLLLKIRLQKDGESRRLCDADDRCNKLRLDTCRHTLVVTPVRDLVLKGELALAFEKAARCPQCHMRTSLQDLDVLLGRGIAVYIKDFLNSPPVLSPRSYLMCC